MNSYLILLFGLGRIDFSVILLEQEHWCPDLVSSIMLSYLLNKCPSLPKLEGHCNCLWPSKKKVELHTWDFL